MSGRMAQVCFFLALVQCVVSGCAPALDGTDGAPVEFVAPIASAWSSSPHGSPDDVRKHGYGTRVTALFAPGTYVVRAEAVVGGAATTCDRVLTVHRDPACVRVVRTALRIPLRVNGSWVCVSGCTGIVDHGTHLTFAARGTVRLLLDGGRMLQIEAAPRAPRVALAWDSADRVYRAAIVDPDGIVVAYYWDDGAHTVALTHPQRHAFVVETEDGVVSHCPPSQRGSDAV